MTRLGGYPDRLRYYLHEYSVDHEAPWKLRSSQSLLRGLSTPNRPQIHPTEDAENSGYSMTCENGLSLRECFILLKLHHVDEARIHPWDSHVVMKSWRGPRKVGEVVARRRIRSIAWSDIMLELKISYTLLSGPLIYHRLTHIKNQPIKNIIQFDRFRCHNTAGYYVGG